MSDADRKKWDQRYTEGAYSTRDHPSPFLTRWLPDCRGRRALDVACGAGRNTIYLAQQGFEAVGVDISTVGLERARARARALGLELEWHEQDLEQPLAVQGRFDLIVIIRYVDLGLIANLAQRLNVGGVILCEQHMVTRADVAGPRGSRFRVAPGELEQAVAGLELRFAEEVLTEDPDGQPVALARVVAARPED